jgi:hypothetical protein
MNSCVCVNTHFLINITISIHRFLITCKLTILVLINWSHSVSESVNETYLCLIFVNVL